MGTGSNQHETTRIVVLFDGVCNLCNGFVNWAIDRDPDSRLRFLALQTPAGRAVADLGGVDADQLSTVVAIRSGRVLVRSSAVLEIGAAMPGPPSFVAKALRLVPSPLRDVGYRLVAASRYRLFGRRDACRVPTPELLGRFLDPDDEQAAVRAAGLENGRVATRR